MAQWSETDICGIEVQKVDCDTGELSQAPEDLALSCAVVDYNRSAVLTEGADESDPSGKTNKNCAKRVIDPVKDYWDYQFTLCSKTDARLMALLGLVDPIFDPADPTVCVGVMDLDQAEEGDQCCPVDEGCVSDEVSLAIWHLAWCGEDPHPDFLYSVHLVPRIKFRCTTDSIERGTGFRTMTVAGRTSKPRAGYGQGPGNISPIPITRHHANVLTNTPFPGGCDCGTC